LVREIDSGTGRHHAEFITHQGKTIYVFPELPRIQAFLDELANLHHGCHKCRQEKGSSLVLAHVKLSSDIVRFAYEAKRDVPPFWDTKRLSASEYPISES